MNSQEASTIALAPHQSDGPSNSRSSLLFHQNHVMYLRRLIQTSEARHAWVVYQLQKETEHQKHIIQELSAANNTFRQHLWWQEIAHARIKQALEIEKKLRIEATDTAARQHQELIASQEAHYEAEQYISMQEKQSAELAAELDCTQRKFHLVDSLVDSMLLQEDSQHTMSDRSRQITDVILDLESQMESKYRAILQEKDEEIERLVRRVSEQGRCDELPRKLRRVESDPGCI
ncbi:hypothetical protein Plec18167_001883 [Paecilomyces lecythidis]|uniref:Uncharacterized protein n=1 Tax=Paecilomyces lecythidis TaxID=3004212 RepID=A0ABR3YA94_9EURO